ncbi:MAG: hypothetical protein HXX15_12750 [Rhodopseudomonas sp.]|uniref:hypothetical protein n=1 Tax=Rhodopseudomonas sp. TaxID=1078 RepID=UPI0017BA30B9|nr:hypothetical protein [Rhodopseudomonas sp.]NVN86942.1 hypothetical protein [Rhodopseudomonas sp.]
MGAISLGTNGYSTALQLLQSDLSKNGSAETPNSSVQIAPTAAAKSDASPGAVRADETSSNSASPDDLKAKIDALIKNEVSNGRLTSDQAIKLQNVFSIAFEAEAAGHGGVQGDGTEAPATKPADASPSAAGSAAASPATSAGRTASASSEDVGSILNDFLKLLQDAQSTASGYGARGNSSATATSKSAQLINYRA